MKAVERWKQVKEEKSLHFPFKAPCVAGFKKAIGFLVLSW